MSLGSTVSLLALVLMPVAVVGNTVLSALVAKKNRIGKVAHWLNGAAMMICAFVIIGFGYLISIDSDFEGPYIPLILIFMACVTVFWVGSGALGFVSYAWTGRGDDEPEQPSS